MQFLLVYVREAHASDEWVTPDNPAAGISIRQPRTDDERFDAARVFCARQSVPFDAVVDGVDDAVGRTWGGWPDRLYVVDAEGRVAYRGGVGPFGFRPKEVAEFLPTLFGESAPKTTSPKVQPPATGAP